ncbi:MAG: hypothetical protein QOG63_908 [Thermoleophilaceae bacterium]|nr:hypothetical protein [Thermoleophilaceae bacterium]
MVRLAALMGAGSFGVHQGRYALGYRGHAGDALAAQGHAYLGPVAALVAGALVLLSAELVRRAARGESAGAPRFGRLWAGSSAALVAVYVAQELVEGALSGHHPDGLAAVAGHGGWLAIPLALAVGLLISVLLRGSAEVPAPRRPWRAPAPLAPLAAAPPAPPAPAVRTARLSHLARGPPLLCA